MDGCTSSLAYKLTALSRSVCLALATLYGVLTFFWAMPSGFPLRPQVVATTSPLYNFLGLWQSWNLFAPNPANLDLYLSADLLFADGKHVEQNISHMSQLDYFHRYQKERWRKWANDSLYLDANRDLWVAAAEGLRQQFEKDYGQSILAIQLIRHWQSAVEPDLEGKVPPRAAWRSYTFYRSPVHQPKAMHGT